MRCRHCFSFALVALLSFFFGSFIITNNTSATSVTCSQRVTEMLNNTNYSLASCDTSSLNSSSPWFYYFDVTSPGFDNVTSRNSYLCFSSASISCGNVVSSFDSNTYNFSFRVNSRVFNSSSYFSFSDVPSSRISYFNLNYGSGTPTVDFTYSLTIYDTLSSNCPASPSGDISITSNGTYDVSSYATATVDVPAEVVQGDYHDDLVNIQNAIITCGAILLVLYFFYCIYRLIIKNSGVH